MESRSSPQERERLFHFCKKERARQVRSFLYKQGLMGFAPRYQHLFQPFQSETE